jgi:hypothetical protein
MKTQEKDCKRQSDTGVVGKVSIINVSLYLENIHSFIHYSSSNN